MNDNSTVEPDIMISQLKSKGFKNKDIAPIVYPHLPLESAIVKVSRHITKGKAGQYIEQSKTIALKEHNVTWDRLIKKLEDKLDATKSDFHTGALLDDHATQLTALKILISLIDTKPDKNEPPPLIGDLPPGIDEIQLVRLLKNPPNQA